MADGTYFKSRDRKVAPVWRLRLWPVYMILSTLCGLHLATADGSADAIHTVPYLKPYPLSFLVAVFGNRGRLGVTVRTGRTHAVGTAGIIAGQFRVSVLPCPDLTNKLGHGAHGTEYTPAPGFEKYHKHKAYYGGCEHYAVKSKGELCHPKGKGSAVIGVMPGQFKCP